MTGDSSVVARPSRTSPREATRTPARVQVTPGRSRGRPPVISTERLLAVARGVFLELGIRATTSEVATRAGIAEGTIFHRFKSKQELFRAAMDFDPDRLLAMVEQLPHQAQSGELRQTLVDFAQAFIELGRVAMPVMMMSWSNPESQLCAERTSERATRYQRTLTALSGFFQAEIARARLRPADPEVLSRMLIGSLHHFCVTELLMGNPPSKLGQQEFAEQVVDVLLASPPPVAAGRPATKP